MAPTSIRQLFRLALEATLYWIVLEVTDRPQSTDALADRFLAKVKKRPKNGTARQWLRANSSTSLGPIDLTGRIESAYENAPEADLPSCIVDALAFCLNQPPAPGSVFERPDRLPLVRAQQEANAWINSPIKAFVKHLLESWVLAQHVYWSVGRGLADARARGKTILRLKVILEEGGWTTAPGAAMGPPRATQDRLETMLSLSRECGSLDGRAGP
jgi:hypothetical protein